MVDFNKLLARKVDEVEKPKPVPIGTYAAVILSHKFGEARNENKTPFVQFDIQLLAAQPDVDDQDLAEAGGMEKVKERRQRLDFYLTEDALWRLSEFLTDTLGLNTSGRSFDETLPETTGQALNVHISHRPSTKNQNEVFANIDSYAAP